MKYSSFTKQPRKQRKNLYNAPLHLKQKLVSVHLTKELRKAKKKRSLAVKKGDKVKIMRGKFRGKEGKVARVSLNKLTVFVEGILLKKQAGKEVMAALQPSNLMITELETRK